MATEARIKITAQDDSAAAFRKATANLDALQQSAASLGTALGSSLAVGGLTLLVKNAIDAADNLRDLSQQTGIAATTLGGLGFAATQNGGSLESVASAAGKLNKNLAEAAAGSKEALAPFQALGINIRDAAGQTKKADVVFGELADKFSQFEDGPEKAALALKIFGKAGAEQITLLNEGGSALRANIAYYERFSGVTQSVADQADRFNDTLGKLKLLGGSLSTTIAASLLPGLQAVADELLAMKENGSGFGVVGDALRVTFEAIAISAANVKFVLVGVGREAGAIAAQLAALARGDFAGFSAISDAVKADGVKARAELDALEKRILGVASLDNARTNARLQRQGATTAKTGAPGIAGGGGSTGTKADPLAEAKRYLDNLQKQLDKTKELTFQEQLLADIQAGRIKKLTPALRESLETAARELDVAKELATQRKKDLTDGEERNRQAGQTAAEIAKTEAAYQQYINTLLDNTPTRQLEAQQKDVAALTAEFEKGVLSEQLYLEAVSARLGLASDKLKDAKTDAEDFNTTFAKGLEDVIFSGKKLVDVIKDMAVHALKVSFKGLQGDGEAGGGGGGLLASLGLNKLFGGFFAAGGSPPLNRVSVVGEKGPELFVPKVAGTIVPSGQIGGGSVVITINQTVGDLVTGAMLQKNNQALVRQIQAGIGRSQNYGGALS